MASLTVSRVTAQEGVPAGAVFSWVNLQGDIAGVGLRTDADLVNPWGLVVNPYTNSFWVVDNGTGVSTSYHADGESVPLTPPVVNPALLAVTVTVPLPPCMAAGPRNAPTSVVVNPSATAFKLGNGAQPATLIFCTDNGGIFGWNPDVNLSQAIRVVDNATSLAAYTALALAQLPDGSLRMYATDFYNGRVDAFDGAFNIAPSAGGFLDPNLPAGFAPYGIANLDGLIYVTYAMQAVPDSVEPAPGPGNGLVNVFDVQGRLQRRLISQGPLNAPWGLARVPTAYGEFGHSTLLVGNFGDGRINAFDLSAGTGAFVGPLQNAHNEPLVFDGLRALLFYGNRLYFTAGIAHGFHGLFGFIYNTP